MINRKGRKTDRTVVMENIIYKYFADQYNILLEHEHRLQNGCIPDFYKEIIENGKKQDSLIIEIKQSISDFYSGFGLNFIGSSNYIAVPSDLVGFTINFIETDKKNQTNVGIIEVTATGLVRIVRYPRWGFFTPYHLLQKRGKINVSIHNR